MPSHFSAIGFPVHSQEEWEAIVLRAAASAEPLETETGYAYLPWRVDGGVELWAQQMPDGALFGCNPHFSGTSRIRLRVTKVASDESNMLDGAIEGWVNPEDDVEESGSYPIRIDMPDFELVRSTLEASQIVTMQVAAFAHELHCYASEEAFAKDQTWQPKLAPKALIPIGLFPPANPEGGGTFFHLVVRTFDAEFDVVADPESVTGDPIVGGVVQGTFWLSGRVVQPGEPHRSHRPIVH